MTEEDGEGGTEEERQIYFCRRVLPLSSLALLGPKIQSLRGRKSLED